MSIIYVIFSFTVGGIETLLVDMMNKLESKNNKIYLCVINNNYDRELLKRINPNVEILLLNREEKGSKLKYILQYTRFILKNKIDIIHCQGVNPVKFSVLVKILRPRTKIFNTIHDVRVYTTMSKMEVLIDKLMCKKIIAISDIVKKEILSRGVKENQVEKIYNAIDLQKFKNNENKVFDKENIVLGNVARLMPEKKGQDILIKAVAKLKDKYPGIKCVLAGGPAGGDISILNGLKELAKKYDVEKNIIFEGSVSDVPSFLKKIDIFIMPSRFEGFGISLIEAMAMKKPCIASDIDGPVEIIKENKYGILFRNGDYEDLTIKIQNMIENIESYDVDKVVEYVENNFSITEMLNKVSKTYSN